jgi:hypothetical protein
MSNNDAHAISTFLKDKVEQHNSNDGNKNMHAEAAAGLNSTDVNNLVFNSQQKKDSLTALYAAYMPPGVFAEFGPNGEVKTPESGDKPTPKTASADDDLAAALKLKPETV